MPLDEQRLALIAQRTTLGDLNDALPAFSSVGSSKFASLLRPNVAVSEKVGFAAEQTFWTAIS